MITCRTLANRTKCLLSALVLGMSALPVQAAVITWGAATDISDDSDVSILGTLVHAYNFNGDDTSVFGVPFQATPVSPITSADPLAQDPFTSATLDGWTTGYKSLLGSGFKSDRDSTLSLTGLSIGQTYQVQFWASEAGGYGTKLSGGQDAGVTLSADLSWDDLDVFGQFVLGTFTADASTQTIFVRPDEVWSLNGYQLRTISDDQTVPEPGALALVGLGLVGIGWMRRRALSRTC